MLELTLLLEFLSYLNSFEYDATFNDFENLISVTYEKVKYLLQYLLNDKYTYLLNNLYNDNDLSNFLTSIIEGLNTTNTNLIDRAIKLYSNEFDNNIMRPRICPNLPLITIPKLPNNDNYFPEYKYLSETTSGNTNISDINPDEIKNENIKISGRQNFLLIPQNSSYYPYVLVNSDKIGSSKSASKSTPPKSAPSSIINFKNKIGNQIVKLNHIDKSTTLNTSFDLNDNKNNIDKSTTLNISFDFNDNKNNIHYVSMNKSIMMYNDNEFMLSFNLFRIKFNMVLKNIVKKIDVNNSCNSTPNESENSPSEFLDVGISSKFDTMYNVLHLIEADNPSVIFNITLPQIPGLLYGDRSRITSYNIRSIAYDLNNILFNNQKIPWLDGKYNKRLIRLLFYILNISQDMYNLEIDLNLKDELKPINQIEILNSIIGNLNITIDNFNINYLLDRANPNIIQPGENINNIITEYINNISNGSIFNFTLENIEYLLQNKKKLEELIMFKKLYTYAPGLYSFIPIFLIIIHSFKRDVDTAVSQDHTNQIINRYASLIKIFYQYSSINFDIEYYIDLTDPNNPNKYENAKNKMNKYILTDFIKQVGLLFNNIKTTLDDLSTIFIDGFLYDEYNIFETNF
jgi:hypothetical protein